MKERPILFSAPMVRAILDGKKTQTRRVAKVASLKFMSDGDKTSWCIRFSSVHKGAMANYGGGKLTEDQARRIIASQYCPYGKIGDRLWVRETWGVISHTWNDDGDMVDWVPDRPATAIHEMQFGRGYYSGHIIYAADGDNEWAGDDDGGGEPRSDWHPSIHMPRLASRITLEVTGVRVERLNDISGSDAVAEGVRSRLPDNGIAVAEYRDLWQSINGAGSWIVNPLVWVIEFEVVK